jgi:hypothetical protein
LEEVPITSSADAEVKARFWCNLSRLQAAYAFDHGADYYFSHACALIASSEVNPVNFSNSPLQKLPDVPFRIDSF